MFLKVWHKPIKIAFHRLHKLSISHTQKKMGKSNSNWHYIH